MSKLKTRRQQIMSEQQADLRKLLVISFLVLIIIVFALISLLSRGSRKNQGSGEAVRPKTQTESALPLPEGITSFPRIVGGDKKLDPDYVPGDIVPLYGVPNGTKVRLRESAALSFEQMYEAMLADGLALIPVSGYVSYAAQEDLYDGSIARFEEQGFSEGEAEKKTLETVPPPGTSEHQTGLAVDVSADGTTSSDFLETPQGAWLLQNAHLYGFIVRYPEDKVKITGVGYEPWHLRYVGAEHAAYIHESGLSLEEYVKLVRESIPGVQEEE